MAEKQPSTAKTAPLRAVDEAVRLYGDLLYDLCESIMWSPANAQLAFRSVLKKIRARHPKEPYQTYERAWVLSIACGELLAFALRHGPKLSASEQIQLDSSNDIPNRLGRFDAYFHRLQIEDQLLLLLKDKYGLPYPEIAAAIGQPEGSLKIRRSQSLRALEEWIWESR